MSEIDAVIWLQRAPLALAGLISYREGPVGPYGEAFVAPLGPRGAQVTFMAVDSEPSMEGGRGNWALPKEIARFDGDAGTPGRVTVSGDGWTWAVTTRARPRSWPALGVYVVAQPWPDGVVRPFRVTVRGRARLGSVEVGGRGRHAAVLISGRQVVGPPAR